MSSLDPTTAATLVTSVSALLVSVFNLYLSQAKAGTVRVIAGETLNVHHFRNGNCGISVPVTVTNTGARSVTVRRFGLLVQSGAGDAYLLEPLWYEKPDGDGNMQNDSFPVPVAVAGNSAETRQVLFRSSTVNPSEFRFTTPGNYRVTVFAWLRAGERPQAKDTFEVTLPVPEARRLAERLEAKDSSYVRVRQSRWSGLAAHILTPKELERLGSA